MNRARLLVFVVGTLLVWANPVIAQCHVLTQWGIFDYAQLQTDEERASSFVNWFRNNSETSYQDAKKMGINFGIPIDGVPVEFGFTNDENGWAQTKALIEQYSQGQKSEKSHIAAAAQKVNEALVRAVSSCLAVKGLHVYLETTPDPTFAAFTPFSVAMMRADTAWEAYHATMTRVIASAAIDTDHRESAGSL